MRSFKLLLVLLLIITINTSSAEETTDPRLSQKVSYQAVGKNVEQVLRELSTMTGVKLKAGYNDLDWQVRDRKMVIAVKDVPLANLMNSISRTMKFNWSKNSEVDPPTYRLYMDRKLLLEANRLMKEQLDSLRQEVDEKRAAELEKLLSLADASPEQLAEVKNKNPRMYVEAKTGAVKPLLDLFNASPDLYQALLAGQEVDITASFLSPAGQQALLSMMGKLAKLDNLTPLNWHPVHPLPSDFASRIGQIKIRVNPELSKFLLNPFSRGVFLGSLVAQCEGWVGGFGCLLNPDSSKIVRDKMDLKEAEEGVTASEAFRAYETEYQQARIAERRLDPSGEPLIEHPEDPDLEEKVKLNTREERLAAYQIALADESKFGVVSDWYGSYAESIGLTNSNISIHTILDQIQDRYHYNWERHGKVLEFRDRHWYWKRSAQIPEAWLEDWRNTLRETGTLDLDKLVQVSKLTAEQFHFNIPGDEFFAGDIARNISAFCGFGLHGPIMQAYGTLDARERKQMFAGGAGLLISDLSPEAQKAIDKFFSMKRESYLDDPRPNIRLTATRKKLGKQIEYTFKLTPDNEYEPVEIKFTTPKYEPKVVKPTAP